MRTPGLLIVPLMLFVACKEDLCAGSQSTAPITIYTDIISGPNSGGENDRGAYLSIFGRNFGTAGLGTTVRVYINHGEVDNYRYLGPSMGRPDIQQITVQIGALGNPTPGIPLPISVTVDGTPSDTNLTFTVNPGRILFVDNVNGNDQTAVPGDIDHPYRHVQTTNASAAAYGALQPGDILVLRGRGTVYNDIGLNSCFLRFPHKSGSSPTGGAATGPIAIMPYPGQGAIEAVAIANGYAAISGIDRTNPSYEDGGAWITIAGLHVESTGTAGVINLQIAADHWRIINNDLSEPNAASVHVRAGGVNGNGTNIICYGNTIHDITGSSGENHGIYIDGNGSYDIAYNHLYNINDGYGIQQYNDGSNGSTSTDAMLIHHNLIHDVTGGKSCINIADGSAAGFRIWNNVCFNARNSGLRFNTLDLVGCKVFNNTFYHTDASGNYGVIQNDWADFDSTQVVIINNIIVPSPGGDYLGGQNFGPGVLRNNLWYGAGGVPAEDLLGIYADPQFVSAGSDFHLLGTSEAIDKGSAIVQSLVNNDYDVSTTRPQGLRYDIGAFEFGDTTGTTSVALTAQPARFQLLQNWPNPCNPSTTIAYQVGAGSRQYGVGSREKAVQVKLAVYDLLGREVAVLVNGHEMPGEHRVVFNAAGLASGTYFYRLTANGQSLCKKLVVLK